MLNMMAILPDRELHQLESLKQFSKEALQTDYPSAEYHKVNINVEYQISPILYCNEIKMVNIKDKNDHP